MFNALDMWQVHRYVRAVAQESGLEIVWENENKPRTDGKRIYLPRITSNITAEQAEDLMYAADHECSHVLYSKFDTEDGINAETSLLGGIINALEDNRIDYLTAKAYDGSRIIGDSCVSRNIGFIGKTIKDSLGKSKKDPELFNTLEKVSPLVSWMGQSREGYYHQTAQTGRDLQPIVESISPKAKEYMTKLLAGDYADVLRNIADGTTNRDIVYKKIVDLASRIYKEVYDQDPEKEKERCKKEYEDKKGKAEGKAKDQDSDESSASAGQEGGQEGDGEGKQTAGKAKSGSDDGGEQSKEFTTIKWSAIVPDNHSDEMRTSKAGQHIDYSDYKPGARDAYEPSYENTAEIDFRTRTCTKVPEKYARSMLGTSASSGGYGEEIKRYLSQNNTSDSFANKVRQMLQIRAKARTQYGTKNGKLHAGNINRITLSDAGSYAERIFKKKEEKDLLDISISIVTDMSGSMGGAKVVHATVAAMLLNHTLGNILHIPIEMLGFTEMGRNNLMYIWRRFSDKLVSNDKIVEDMSAATSNMTGNRDGEAIMYAYQRIIKQKTKRKMIIVLSDGSPASGADGDDVAFLEQIIKGVQSSPVEIIGIGIRDDNVKRFYKENYVINNSNELERALLSLIDKKLT